MPIQTIEFFVAAVILIAIAVGINHFMNHTGKFYLLVTSASSELLPKAIYPLNRKSDYVHLRFGLRRHAAAIPLGVFRYITTYIGLMCVALGMILIWPSIQWLAIVFVLAAILFGALVWTRADLRTGRKAEIVHL